MSRLPEVSTNLEDSNRDAGKPAKPTANTVRTCWKYIRVNQDQPIDKLALMCFRLFDATREEFKLAVHLYIDSDLPAELRN